MAPLWLAIVIYSIGLGVVLHLRPALMFNENGTWKEFGYQREVGGSRYTIFPFWLFAISWAFVSYAMAAGISWNWGARAGMMAAAAASATPRWSSLAESEEVDEDESAATEEDEESIGMPVSETIRVPRGRRRPQTPARKPRPGYYVLDPASQSTAGLRRYIYFGDAPPANGQSDGAVA
ncbi:hypothetical protein EBZ80_17380 [bacterium]|nr:hypothetical protein [bacterium]